MKPELSGVLDEFLAQWGALGSAWGINRTMAQIHALLLVSSKPKTTDEVMEELKISRGNAHTNLRELTGWGLARSFVAKGERKERFEAEKDVWRIFCIVARERKRREIDPAIHVLKKCAEHSRGMKNPEAAAFHGKIEELLEFAELAGKVFDALARGEKSALLPYALRFIR